MLALTRKRGESIIIGDNVEVVILSIQGEQVKLGILAPRSVPVHRKEIYELIQQENKESTVNLNINLGQFQKMISNIVPSCSSETDKF